MIDQVQQEFGRLKVFRACARFKSRLPDFSLALSKDRGPVWFIVNRLIHSLYLHDCCSEYGLSSQEGVDFLRKEINLLPQRYRFLTEGVYDLLYRYNTTK